MRKFIQSLAHDERGVSALEYAILAGLIVTVLVTAVGTFSGDLATAFTNLGAAVTKATTVTP